MVLRPPLVSCFQSKNKWCGWVKLPPGFFLPVKKKVVDPYDPFCVSWFLFTTKTNRWRACVLGGLTAPVRECSSAVERYPSKLDVVGSIPITRFSTNCHKGMNFCNFFVLYISSPPSRGGIHLRVIIPQVTKGI